MNTINTIMVVCGWIITLGGAGAVIYKLFSSATKPKKDMDAQIKALESDMKEIKQKLDRDYSVITSQKESVNLLTRSMFGLIEHEITGNNVDSLKGIRDELIGAMTEKSSG